MSTVHWFRGREAGDCLIWAPRSNLGEISQLPPGLRDMATSTGDQNSIRRYKARLRESETQLETLGGTLGAEDNVRMIFTPSTILVRLRMGEVHSLFGQYINVLEYNTGVSILS